MTHHFDPHTNTFPRLLQGEVVSGLGEGVHFMALEWVLAQCREQLGFTPSPGTFNLHMQGEHWEQLRQALRIGQPGAKQFGIKLTPPAGYCAASCFALRVGDKIDAYGIVPHIDDYPHDKLEIIAPVNIRTALGVANSDLVSIALHDGRHTAAQPLRQAQSQHGASILHPQGEQS